MVNYKITNQDIEQLAKMLGFDLVGFADYELLESEYEHLNQWLSKKYQAGMQYMERNTEKRRDVKEVFPDTKSVIALGMNYFTNYDHNQTVNKGKLSRYSWGKDYHFIIWKKLDELKSKLQELNPEFDCLGYVDTGPVLDKVWAVKAGLGWQGKNSNVINKNIGSWFFIAIVLTNQELEPSKQVWDHCGSCTKCIDACPTNAIREPYVIDANRCISYLTIENKKEIPEEFRGKLDNWLFGCDICQDVCPWNIKYAVETEFDEFQPYENETELDLEKIGAMTNSEFKKRFKESPVLRAKLKGLKRNAEFIVK